MSATALVVLAFLVAAVGSLAVIGLVYMITDGAVRLKSARRDLR